MFRIVQRNAQIGPLTAAYTPGQKAPQGFLGAPEIDPAKCTGCGKCVLDCPTEALRVKDDVLLNKRHLFFALGDCIYCGLCQPACPYEAVSFKGKYELAVKNKEDLRTEFPFSLSTCSKDPAFVPEEKLPSCEIKPSYLKDKKEGAPLQDIGTKLKEKINHLFGRSLHIRQVDAGSCNGCEVEIHNLSNPLYDVERFGIHFVASPRHADMLLVTGPVTKNMEQALKMTFEATPSPKLVVALGGCAVAGGIFKTSSAVVGGVDGVIPVDVYIPGCPPRPEAILHGIFLALDKIV